MHQGTYIYIFLEKTILSSLTCHLGLCIVVYELLPVPLICVYLPGPHSLDCSSMVLHGSDGSLEGLSRVMLVSPCTLMSCVPWARPGVCCQSSVSSPLATCSLRRGVMVRTCLRSSPGRFQVYSALLSGYPCFLPGGSSWC